jgi:hypothetical protein
VALLLAGSQIWQPKANQVFLNQLFSQTSNQDEKLWEPGLRSIPLSPEVELIKLRKEVGELKRMLQQSNTIRKDFGEDLRLLSVEVIGELWRQHGGVAALNVGHDYGIQEGDWLIHDGSICGKVTGVSNHTSLISELTSPNVRAFVTVEGLEGEVIWEGRGGGVAWVHVRRDAAPARDLVGRKIYLSLPLSREGHFVTGQVSSVRPALRGGWWLLEAKGRVIPRNRKLFVVQPHEPSSSDIFARRDRLDELKKQVRELELNKLRMELLQP